LHRLTLGRESGFPSWPKLQPEVARRRVLDLHDAAALAAFIAGYPDETLYLLASGLSEGLSRTPAL
jgi:hypothetical protein